MNHQIDLAAESGLEREPGVGEEIRAAPAAVHPRPRGQVEAEMRIPEQDNTSGPHNAKASPRVVQCSVAPVSALAPDCSLSRHSVNVSGWRRGHRT